MACSPCTIWRRRRAVAGQPGSWVCWGCQVCILAHLQALPDLLACMGATCAVWEGAAVFGAGQPGVSEGVVCTTSHTNRLLKQVTEQAVGVGFEVCKAWPGRVWQYM